MGGNISKTLSEQNVNINTINKSEINAYSETLYSTSVDSTVKVCNIHASEVSAENLVELHKLKSAGDVNLTVDQSNAAQVKFTSEVVEEIKNEIDASITSQLTNDIMSSVDSSVAMDLIGKAASNVDKGWGAMNFGDQQQTEVKTNLNINTENNIKTNIENIVEMVVNYSLNTESINKCMSKTTTSNGFKVFSAEAGGDINLQLTQKNEVESITDCFTSVEIINSLVSNLLGAVGITVEDDMTQDVKGSSESGAESITSSQGVGGAFAEAAEGIGNMINSAFKSTQYIFIAVALCVCCVLIIAVVVIGYILTDEQGGKNVQALANLATDVIPQTRAAKTVGTILGGFFEYFNN